MQRERTQGGWPGKRQDLSQHFLVMNQPQKVKQAFCAPVLAPLLSNSDQSFASRKWVCGGSECYCQWSHFEDLHRCNIIVLSLRKPSTWMMCKQGWPSSEEAAFG